MAVVDITIKDRIATTPAGVLLICNNPTDTIRFNFDDEWADHDVKTARFAWEGKYIDVPFSGNEVQVPEIYRTNYVYVGVFTDNLTSVAAKIPCKFSIKCLGGNVPTPSEDVYTEIIALINNTREFTPRPFEESGELVQVEFFEDFPLDCLTVMELTQSGSGDPAPDNIRPITVRTGAELVRCGKNLLKTTAVTNAMNGVTFTVNADGTVAVSGTATATALFIVGRVALKANTTYACGSSVTDIGFSLRTGNGATVIHDFAANNAYTPTEDAELEVCIRVGNGKTVNATVYPQIEVGAAATAYEPYAGDVYTLDFGQTVYGGTLDWNTGVLTVDKALLSFNGAENWVYHQNGFVYVGISEYARSDEDEVRSSHYPMQDFSTGVQGVIIVSTGTYYNQLRFYGTGYTDVAAWKAYLAAQHAAGTPVQVCYKLASPITIQLAPQQITALAGLNTVWSDAGETTVSGRKDILWLTHSLVERIAALENALISMGGNV